MKVTNKLAVLLGLGVLPVIAASAATSEQAYLESCRKAPGVPVPVVVVSPHVSSEYIGSSVELEFLVDTTGKPSDITVKSSPDLALSDAVVDAVKQWLFTPVQRDGSAVATKVDLPVHIVDGSHGNGYASN